MLDDRIETSKPSIPPVGSFVTVRGKTWIVEKAEQRGPVQALTLISCEDDSQGEAIELVYAAELQPDIKTVLWSKFMFICGFSGVTALTRLTIGPILDCPETKALFALPKYTFEDLVTNVDNTVLTPAACSQI